MTVIKFHWIFLNNLVEELLRGDRGGGIEKIGRKVSIIFFEKGGGQIILFDEQVLRLLVLPVYVCVSSFCI